MGSLSQHVGSSSCGLWHLLVGACEMFVVPECRIFVAACGILLRHVGSLAVACGILVAAFRDQTCDPALAGGFFTTEPPWKSLDFSILNAFVCMNSYRITECLA